MKNIFLITILKYTYYKFKKNSLYTQYMNSFSFEKYYKLIEKGKEGGGFTCIKQIELVLI